MFLMRQKIHKVYDYRGSSGWLIAQTIRHEPKSFLQRRIVDGHFVWGLKAGWYEKRPHTNDLYPIKDAEPDKNKRPHDEAIWLENFKPVLYRLPEIISAIEKGKKVFICEGEKDADNLSALGFEATTNPMGANKWKDSYTKSLKGCKEVIIVADKDEQGRKHAKDVAKQLSQVGIPVKQIEMPNRNGTSVNDTTDWLKAGGTKQDFENLCRNAEVLEANDKYAENSPDKSVDESFAELIDEYGQPYYENDKGTVTSINESFWAGLYFSENIVLYEPDERRFYLYDHNTGAYKKITEDKIKRELSKRIFQVSQEIGRESLEKLRRNSVLNSVVAHLKGIAERWEAFKKVTNFVHVGNSIIIFKENGDSDFVEFSPKLHSRNQSPIFYDPDANCSRFLNEFLLPAVSKEDALLIKKYAGLCLLGKNLIQRLLLLDGLAATGKSTLSLIIQKVVGLNNVTQLRTNHLGERFELFRFRDKALLTGIDVRGNFLSDKGAYVIKGLVGGDYFDTEQKGGTASFPIQGDFCIIITSNSRLQVRLDGDVGAWRRRLLIVRFESPLSVMKIPNLADLLIEEEGSGILNWSLEGLRLVLEDIDEYGDIRLEGGQRKIVDALMAESDSVRHFMNDRVVKREGSDLTVNEIVENYAEYCSDKRWNPKPITVIQRELDELMLELFGTTKSHSIKREEKSARGFRGVSLGREDSD